MKATDAFPSKYISASDLGGQEVTVKITHIAPEEIGGKQKYICYFAGKKKGLVLNKTNWNTIARISGRDDTDDWTGVEICLYEAMVDFQGDSVPAVRIKAPPRRASIAAGNITTGPQRVEDTREYTDERSPQPPMRQRDPNDEIPF
jgi:hypothetical protein